MSQTLTSYAHVIVFVDHHKAEILPFDHEGHDRLKVMEHPHATAQHGSEVRAIHEFFSDVCEALSGYDKVLVVGPKTGVADFRRYLGKYRPYLLDQVAGYDTVDHLTLNQLIAFGRKFFDQHERMVP